MFGGKKYAIPPPTQCPPCRLQRRLAAINQYHVYRRRDSASGKTIFSQFSQEAPFPVYENADWWSDRWDALFYGQSFDVSRPFFGQFHELCNVVPHFALMVLRNENCDYCNNCSDCNNCYLIFNTRRSEDCICCERIVGCRDCVDCTDLGTCELCCNCVSCSRCYKTQHCRESDDCKESFFLMNCRSCSDCFGCVNLRHARYCIFNEQKSEKEYKAFMAEAGLSSFARLSSWREKAEAFWKMHPRPHAVIKMSENVSGNHLVECRDVHDSYLIREGERLRRCALSVDGVRDCRDYTTYGDRAELVYESARSGNGIFRISFCAYCYDGCAELLYCSFCVGCEYCFGCVGLRKKRYCILNRQYSKEEYEALVPGIITHMQAAGEWGEFFPLAFSAFPYNHSLAQRYFPIGKDQAKGLPWHEVESATGAVNTIVDLPDALPETDDSLTAVSADSGKIFSITSQELRRYRKIGAPLPRTSYDERINARAALLGGFSLYDRTCAKTGKPIKTTISPDAPWIVWDKEVYEAEFSS